MYEKNNFASSFMNMWKMFDPSQSSNMSQNASCVDFKQFTDMQKNNVETFAKVVQNGLENVQSIANRQAEMIKCATKDAYETIKSTNFSNPSDIISKQTEVAKQAIENWTHNGQELASMAFKAWANTFDTLSKRAGECVEESASVVKNQMNNVQKKANV